MSANPNLASGTAIVGSIATGTVLGFNQDKTTHGEIALRQQGDDMFWYFRQPGVPEENQPYIQVSSERIALSSKSGAQGKRIVVSNQGIFLDGTEVGELGGGGNGGGGGNASGETVDVGTGTIRYRLSVNPSGQLEITKRDLTDPLNVVETKAHSFAV